MFVVFNKILRLNLNLVYKWSVPVLNYFLFLQILVSWASLRGSKKNISVFSITIIFSLMIFVQTSPAIAQTQEYEFNTISGEDIKTNPAALHILAKIELSKKISCHRMITGIHLWRNLDLFIILNNNQWVPTYWNVFVSFG